MMNEKSGINLSPDGGAPSSAIPPTPRNVRVFLCYRRNDGAWYAEWLNEHLTETEYTDSGGKPCRIRIYYDKAAPGVADWKSLHFPSLQASQSLILICTPGIAKDLSKRGHPDWVYEELRWWVENKRTYPIVIDATGEGDRWLPEIIARKWPNVNRIDLDKGQAETAVASRNVDFADRIRERVIGTIKESERATVFEDLERFKRLSRRLKLALVSLCVVMLFLIGATWFALEQRTEAIRQKNMVALEMKKTEAAYRELRVAYEELRALYIEKLDATISKLPVRKIR